MKNERGDNKGTWRPPTRRAFVAMLGAAAASLAIHAKHTAESVEDQEPPRSPWTGTTRWIGHC